jgi:hypothetical protein
VQARLPLKHDTSGNSINYATGATYGPDGAMTGFVSGNSSTFAGITNTYTYNKRLQPVNMSASAPSQTVYSIGYDFHYGAGNNGNVYGITNYKDNTRNQSFGYDQLNRLTSAQNAGTDCTALVLQSKTKFWGNNYGYDAWGTYNVAASFLNTQLRAGAYKTGEDEAGPLQLPLAPTLPINGLGQEVGSGVTTLALIAATGAKGGPAGEGEAAGGAKAAAPKSADPEPAPYNRAEHYGNPATSKAASEVRTSGEGQPCPNCGETMKSGTKTAPTAQHNPTLRSHYYNKGHKLTPAERRAYARSSESIEKNAVCKTCQSKQGAAESRK